MNMKYTLVVFCALASFISVNAGQKLSGTPIGTVDGYNYETSRVEQNIQWRAFDGDLNSYYASNARSYTWVGLDLGTPHIIDKVGWSPRNAAGYGPERLRLGIIQGANRADWLDAVPLYIIKENGTIGRMDYGDISVNKGFRYVRFVSTSDARCNIAELEFYGTPGEGDPDEPNLFQVTNLPTVCINTVDAQEPYDKEHDITSNIVIINDHKAYLDYAGTVRERGNASRSFPKKPWRIKFDKKQKVLPDAPATAKKWTLINNYGDKTLMRNLVAFEIAHRLGMDYVPYGHAVDVILNGEYKGCYQLCDQVEVNKNRVNITEMEPEDTEGDALTGGYLIEVDAYADQEPADEWFSSNYHWIPVTIKSPDPGVSQQYNYIKNYFSDLENRVYQSNFSGDNDYRNMLDIESFLQHFIVGELAGNTDTYWSVYMTKDRGSDKFFTGPVWDFDIAFDNDNRTYPIHDRAGNRVYLFNSGAASSANGMLSFVHKIIYGDTRTKGDIARMWSLARNDKSLTPESMTDFVDALAAELDESQKLNFLRWPIMNEMVHQNPTISGSYEGEVNRLKDYLNTRFNDLDTLMGYDSTITGVSDIEQSEISVKIENNVVSFDGITPFTVYSISGMKVYHGINPVILPAGMYIITASGATHKAAIR